jgi:hypothetical protein
MWAYAQTTETASTADQFWPLSSGDVFSILGFIVGFMALIIAILIYNGQRKLQKKIHDQERAHIVNVLRLTHTLIANCRDHLRAFVTNSIDRTGEINPDLDALHRFMGDLHPIFCKDADRIERALDPLRLHLPIDLDTRLANMTDYFRILADPEENKPVLDIPEAAMTWLSRQRGYVEELTDLMKEIRKFAPEIPETKT